MFYITDVVVNTVYAVDMPDRPTPGASLYPTIQTIVGS